MLERIAKILNLSLRQVENVIQLFEEGATIPFIARYRKEATGSLDEVQIGSIQEEWERQQEIEKRQDTILKAIKDQDKLTPNLEKKIKSTFDLPKLEDIYLPYKKKRQTRAEKAKKKGLEPLAKLLMDQNQNIDKLLDKYLNNEVANHEQALQGAKDIIAEWISEHEQARNSVRRNFEREAYSTTSVSAKKKDENSKYKDYFEFDKPLKKVQPHQLLAIMRAEKEGVLKLDIAPDFNRVLDKLDDLFIKRNSKTAAYMEDAIEDSYKRLIKPSISTEFRNLHKDKADEYSINIFAENLRQLLLAPPLGSKRILAIDPGYATGCKVVCLSKTGDLLDHTVIYPTPPRKDFAAASWKVKSLVEKYKIEAIAIGNGTASRETEQFARSLSFHTPVEIYVVNESGASIYSASAVAREEFPNEDVTVRGSVSIGRRLMDPLAELVKIDPKSIGVGQYQHDVNQKKLQKKLDTVVESCVNAVGVDLNTASHYLLNYVSGLGPKLAQNIVDYRTTNGLFKSRKELKKVKRLGAKAFEQAAGFLRIREGKNPLDNTAVHPESYPIVEKMAKDLNCKVKDLLEKPELRKQIQLRNYVTKTVGMPTLEDILKELEKPGRDPRQKRKAFSFAANIQSIEDIKEGMSLPGIVTNITAFGAFVDIGIKTNGLIHKSKMSNRFVEDPSQYVKLGEELEVTVVGLDLARNRIQLSLVD
ncbi:MAG: RNA-binding transcriptional accessory protein [Saprospiraceae bacterium]|nr:RNA-binding transcriptional accessory protein [Saprospiraceae bacterium]